MLPGFNHNVRFNNRVYHVQTEDIGLKIATVVTQVFLAGQVLALEKTSYQDVLDAGWAESDRINQIRHLMQEQHKTLLKRVTEGAFEARVNAMISDGVPTADPRPSVRPSARSARPHRNPPPFADSATIITDERSLRFDESDFLSSLDAEVRRHIEATDPSLPPFDSSILPAEPPPIPPRTGTSLPLDSGPGAATIRARAPRATDRPPRPTAGSQAPPRTRRPRPARDTLVDQPSPLRAASSQADPRPAAPDHRMGRPQRFRRPTSSLAAQPLEQDELRRTSAEMGLPMPDEASHGDPNATLLELDAVALKAKLAEQRAKLKRASEVAAEHWSTGSGPLSQSEATERMTVTERSLDEVLLSYLDDE